MVTNSNNTYINQFIKGMNTDTSVDKLENSLYVFGQNIRIAQSALQYAETTPNNKRGIVTPVHKGITTIWNIQNADYMPYTRILGRGSIEDVGAIILKDKEGFWDIYRVNHSSDDHSLKFTKLFRSNVSTDKLKFSVVMNRKTAGTVVMYIADGEHQIMLINVLDDEYASKLKTIDDLMSNHIYPHEQAVINKKIAGSIKTSLVLYSYRFYKKNGIYSKLSPFTKRFLVIDNVQTKEAGNAEDIQTGIGFRLQIPLSKNGLFDNVQLYRLQRIKPDGEVKIHLVADTPLPKEENASEMFINDDGKTPLKEYTVDEYEALNGLDIVPKCIEFAQGYMFAANVKDETVLDVKDVDINPVSTNSNGEITLSKSTNYGITKTWNTYYEYASDGGTNKTDLISKYSDINIGDKGTKYNIHPEEYNGLKILGGKSGNVSWRFITVPITLHSNYDMENVSEVVNINSNLDEKNVCYISADGETLSCGKKVNDAITSMGVNSDCISSGSYKDMFVSSMFRSLRRNEVYRYGVIFYDEHGRQSNATWMVDVRTPSEQEFASVKNNSTDFYKEKGTLVAYPIGIEFEINTDTYPYYQIVRCSKDPEYCKNIYLVVVSRPVRQKLILQDSEINKSSKESTDEYSTSSTYSPYYPLPFLTCSKVSTGSFYDNGNLYDPEYINIGGGLMSPLYPVRIPRAEYDATNKNNDILFLIFSPNFNVERETALDVINHNKCTLNPQTCLYGLDMWYYKSESERKGLNGLIGGADTYAVSAASGIDPFAKSKKDRGEKVHWFFHRWITRGSWWDTNKSIEKTSIAYTMFYYNRSPLTNNTVSEIDVVKDVKNPEWNSGFTNIQQSGDNRSGAKQYKSYSTSIDKYDYNNWVSNGMYDLRLFSSETQPGVVDPDNAAIMTFSRNRYDVVNSRGWVGPGPVCLIVKLNKAFDESGMQYDSGLYTLLCNIQHDASQFAGLSVTEKQYDTYYGFGNYGEDNKVTYVFDGDVYINASEFVNMFKTYNFTSVWDHVPSALLVYYIPMESTINTMFDYGMNYLNTQNKNILLEPGEITGLSSQDRPLHQYNLVFSSNSVSDERFSAKSLDEDVNRYPQRIFFSSIDTSNEDVNTYTTFKALDYIDAETRYGDVNNLLAVKDTLYYWQSLAFGKLSVNERSLVTDNNNNTVQLGQGGVLQRTDYLDTKHGMRDQDYSAIAVDQAVYWIDILNKSIMAFSGQVINYGTAMNVQNYINSNIDPAKKPVIDYDVEHGELLCQFDKSNTQLVFNTAGNAAQGIYTRTYDDTMQFNNVLFGILLNNTSYTQHNNIEKKDQKDEGCYLTPTVLSFVVNPNPEITKVFDNQQIVTLKRAYSEEFEVDFMKSRVFDYSTDLDDFTYNNNVDQLITDREGNILYAIPRIPENGQPALYGNRLKGKWMKVTMTDNSPRIDYSISEILTKYRQSYS